MPTKKIEVTSGLTDESSMVLVRLISQQGETALVEYTNELGLPVRYYVPIGIVDGSGNVPIDLLYAGIPVSINWLELITVNTSALEIAKCLYNAGIFTAADVLSNPPAVMGALQQAYGYDLAAILKAAQSLEKG